jgi:hypothetical protein
MKSFCGRDFPSGSRLSAMGIPPGTSKTKAEDNGGKVRRPSGWLKAGICHVERLGRMPMLRHAPLSSHLLPPEPTELFPFNPERL